MDVSLGGSKAAREKALGGPGSRCIAVAYDGDTPRLALWLPGGAGASINNAEIHLYDRQGIPETPQKDASGNNVVSTIYRNNINLIRQSAKKTDSKYNFYIQDPAQVIRLGMNYNPQNPDPTLMVSRASGSLRGSVDFSAFSTWAKNPSVERAVSRPWVELAFNRPDSTQTFTNGAVRREDSTDALPAYLDPDNWSLFLVNQERVLGASVHVQDKSLAGQTIQASLVPPEAGTLAGDVAVVIPTPVPENYVIQLKLRMKGSRPSAMPSQDKIIFAVGGKKLDERSVTMSLVNLTVDSNNDGIANDNDDLIEMDSDRPGKLLYLNHDDDNQNDRADKDDNGTSNGQTFATEDDDLQPIKLAYVPNFSKGKIVVEAIQGGDAIKLWKDARKTAGSLVKFSGFTSYKATWNLPADPVPSQLYIEGCKAASVVLRLSYFSGSDEISRNEVKAGVVSVDFSKTTDTLYGYDDGTVDDYPGRTSKNGRNTPQFYKWVSVPSSSATTSINVTVVPPEYKKFVYFLPDESGSLDCSPRQAQDAPGPQQLTVIGLSQGGFPPQNAFLLCRLGTVDGASANRINVGVFNSKIIQGSYYDVIATGLVPQQLNPGQLASDANSLLSQGVTEIDLVARAPLNIEYDTNGIAGYHKDSLDIDLDAPGHTGGPELMAIQSALPSLGPSDRYYLHVKSLWVRNGGNWNQASLSWYTICGQRCVFFGDEALSIPTTMAHETLHSCSLSDVGPTNRNMHNIMYCTSVAGKVFLGNCAVEKAKTGVCTDTMAVEYQWSQIGP